MTADTKKFFENKRFYLHMRSKSNALKAGETIKVFGGSIDTFLDSNISYVLTDIPKNEWPPIGGDEILKDAQTLGAKLMSYRDLVAWCSKYISSQSSSDEDDEIKTSIKALCEPFLKIEDGDCKLQPIVRQLNRWPEINLNVPNGVAIFAEPATVQTQIERSSQQLMAHQQQTTPTPGTTVRTGVKRKSPIYCDLCELKIQESLEEHEVSEHHRSNLQKTNWGDVESVISSLPSFNSLNMRRIHRLPSDYNSQQEFLCLHKVESVSQIKDMNTSWLFG